MSLLNPADRRFLQTLSDLCYTNPFLPERMELERRALGEEFDERAPVWSKDEDLTDDRHNIVQLRARTEQLAKELREQLVAGVKASEVELRLYEDLVAYVVYDRYRLRLGELVEAALEGKGKPEPARCWTEFVGDWKHFLELPDRDLPSSHDPAHWFACFFQLRRAFHNIYHSIVGTSAPAAQLRAAVWQSIFTVDMRRYRRSMYQHMGDFTTLITGPSGTGKELVARAIGLSRYIPYDVSKRQFSEDFAGSFHPLNLSALSATLIESELFGHCRGAFTGAVSDRAGWLEVCRPLGTVFLDEIGELDNAIQVKLLRVLQTRTFQRLGETTDRRFQGKIIAATNRDLGKSIRARSLREDFYYRLCSDIIVTPSLSDQLADCPDDLGRLLLFISRRIAGTEAESLAGEVEAWVDEHLGRDYPWPGNFRELEQCVRNVIVRGRYQPGVESPLEGFDDPHDELIAGLRSGSLSAEELLRRYCTLIYARTGSYEQSAERLQMDRRTVKSKVDENWLARLRSGSS